MGRERLYLGIASLSMLAADIATKIPYEGVTQPFVRNYGHDVLLPACGYLFIRTLDPGHQKQSRRLFWAVYEFLGCSAFEVAQGLGWYRGTFDPWDFAAYGVGAALGYGIESAILKVKERKDEKTLEGILA